MLTATLVLLVVYLAAMLALGEYAQKKFAPRSAVFRYFGLSTRPSVGRLPGTILSGCSKIPPSMLRP